MNFDWRFLGTDNKRHQCWGFTAIYLITVFPPMESVCQFKQDTGCKFEDDAEEHTYHKPTVHTNRMRSSWLEPQYPPESACVHAWVITSRPECYPEVTELINHGKQQFCCRFHWIHTRVSLYPTSYHKEPKSQTQSAQRCVINHLNQCFLTFFCLLYPHSTAVTLQTQPYDLIINQTLLNTIHLLH